MENFDSEILLYLIILVREPTGSIAHLSDVNIIGSDKIIHSAHEYWPKPTIGLYTAEV